MNDECARIVVSFQLIIETAPLFKTSLTTLLIEVIDCPQNRTNVGRKVSVMSKFCDKSWHLPFVGWNSNCYNFSGNFDFRLFRWYIWHLLWIYLDLICLTSYAIIIFSYFSAWLRQPVCCSRKETFSPTAVRNSKK